MTFTDTASGQKADFSWQTAIYGDTPQLVGQVSVESASYFVNEKEWRVVLEWADDTTELTSLATRAARVGFYVPIVANAFNASKATTRLNAANFYRGGDGRADVIMVSYKKTE